MTAEEWYRANVGTPWQFPETYQHFLNAYNAGFAAGVASQRALVVGPKQTERQRTERSVFLAH